MRDDVWIHYLDRKGNLTAGFGVNGDRIGPELGFGVELDPPGNAASGEELRAGRGGDTPNVSLGVAVVRGHLPAVALPFAFGKIIIVYLQAEAFGPCQ